MNRVLKLALPSLAAGGSRVIQLAVLLVLLATASGGERATLVAGFGVLSAFAIFTDSGAAPFLLQTPADRLSRGLHLRATVFHVLLASAGAAAALVAVALSPGSDPAVLPLLGALALAGVCDSVMRTTRAPLLVTGRDAAYARPEAALVVAKAPFLVWAVVAGSPVPLAGVAAVSAVVLVGTFATSRRGLVTEAVVPRRLYLRILEFGVSGSLSSLYSQAPLVIATLILGVTAAEPLAVAYRLVQPLEFLPATVAAQLLPRLRARTVSPAPWLAAAAATGAVAAGILILLAAPLDALAGGALVLPVFAVIALSAIAKFANYVLVATAMARGLILDRLVVTCGIAVIAVSASIVAAETAGPLAVAGVTLGCELLLFAVMGATLLARHRHLATREGVLA